jgi:hypothetical protein
VFLGSKGVQEKFEEFSLDFLVFKVNCEVMRVCDAVMCSFLRLLCCNV